MMHNTYKGVFFVKIFVKIFVIFFVKQVGIFFSCIMDFLTDEKGVSVDS